MGACHQPSAPGARSWLFLELPVLATANEELASYIDAYAVQTAWTAPSVARMQYETRP